MALPDVENGEQGEPGIAGKESLLGGFSETDETKELISSLPEVHKEALTRERTIERFLGKTVMRREPQTPIKVFAIAGCTVSALQHCLFPPTAIMNGYQEQPHLLDPHLGT